MAELNPSELKVTELRKELGARNLSTKGLKKELVERLMEALQAEGQTETQSTESIEQSEEKAEEDTEVLVNQQDKDENKDAPETPEPNEQAGGPKEDEEEEDDGIDLAPAGDFDDGEAALAQTEAVEQEDSSKVQGSVEETKDNTSTDVSASKEKEDKKEEPPKTEPAPAVPSENPSQSDLKRKLEDADEEPSQNNDTNGGASGEAKDASAVDSSSSSNAENKITGGDAIFIKNLERPLTLFRMRELVEKYGTVKELWLNSIKTRCYVQYSNTDEARAAFVGINGITFPSGHGKVVECGMLTGERLMELIDEEETSREMVRMLDLVSVPVEGGNCGISLKDPRKSRKAKKQKVEKQAEPSNSTEKVPEQEAPGEENPSRIEPVAAKSPEPKRRTKFEMDPFFRKTRATPAIYYRPHTEKEIVERKAMALRASNSVKANTGA